MHIFKENYVFSCNAGKKSICPYYLNAKEHGPFDPLPLVL
jgi:hypothetical protein